MALAVCHYCGNDVDPLSRTTYRRVVGWERKAGVRASGSHGGSDITLRELLDEYACPGCIQLLRSGVAPAQESLL